MMLRSGRVLRAVMTLLAFGVALQGAVPLAMRVCAMHATAHGTAEAIEGASGVADAHERPTHAHDTHGHHASAPDHAPDPAPAHPCDCVSDCCGVPTAVLTFAHAPLAASMRPVDTVGHNNPAPPRTAPTDRLLPFANGPPPHALG